MPASTASRASSRPDPPPRRPTSYRPSRCRNRSPRRSTRYGRATASASGFGDAFVDYFLAIKQDEIARAGAENGSDPAAVTDWEHKEYFDLA